MSFFTFFTMPIVFLRHFYMIYVETAFHVTVPLRVDVDPPGEATEAMKEGARYPGQKLVMVISDVVLYKTLCY